MAELSLGSGCTPNAPEKVPESGGKVRITLPFTEQILSGYVYVLMQNPTAGPRQIGAGAIVGKAKELDHVVEPEELVGESEAEVECMNGVGLPKGMTEVVEKATGGSEQPVYRVESSRLESGVDARKEMLEKLIKVSGEGMTTDEKQSIQDCVVDARDIFALSELERGEVGEIMHEIDTGDSSPIHQTPRQVPFFLRPKISRMVDDTLRAGVMEESKSPWASPVVLVKKTDGELRFCVDYQAQNAVTQKDVFPMPRIDDTLDQLGGKRVFSTLDARTGYWQIRIHGSIFPGENCVCYT